MSMPKARDVMRRRVVALAPDMTLAAAARLFVEKAVTGAPVVEDGRVIGVLSQRDFVRRADEQSSGRVPAFYRDGEHLAIAAPTEHTHEARVREVMTRTVLSVAPGDSLSKVARIMSSKRVHRVIVLDEGKLVGVVSSLDLVKRLA